jgi:hypothetical protein
LTNLKGTTKKSHSFSHGAAYNGAEYTSLGSCYDIQRNAIYFFVYSDLSNHCILRYNIDSDDFDKIVWDNTEIGLDIDYDIADAFMIDNWLYWNPRSSSPRAINVEWGYYDYKVTTSRDAGRTYVVGTLYTDFRSQVWKCTAVITGTINPGDHPNYFDFVSYHYGDVAPIDQDGKIFRYRSFYNSTPALASSLSANIGSDTSYQFNNIRSRLFQFTYRFYIPEQGYTVTAPITPVIGSTSEETFDGEFPGDVTENNKITLSMDFMLIGDSGGNKNYLFENIEVFVRDSFNRQWRSAVKLARGDVIVTGATKATYDFYNNQGLDVADSASVEIPYNFLPRLANSQWSLDGERSAYAGLTEGFNTPNINVDLTANYTDVIHGLGLGALQDTITFTETLQDQGPSVWYDYTTGVISNAGVSATEILVANIEGVKYQLQLAASDVDTAEHYAEAIARVLTLGSLPFRPITGPKVTGKTATKTDFTVKRYAAAASVQESSKYSTFKSGAWHDYALYYYDDILRRSEAIPISSIYIPFTTELGETIGTGFKRSISYIINHEPPTWASWWRFGYAGNSSVSDFWQYTIAAADVSSASDKYQGLSYVDISTLQTITTNTAYTYRYLNSQVQAYSFEEKDRIRFITSKNDSATDGSLLTIDDWSSVQHDYEIVAYDSTTNRVYFNSDGLIGDVNGGGEIDYSSTSVLVELYRPKTSGDSIIYYEVGALNPITGTGTERAHGNPSGELSDGDAYLISRTMVEPPPGFSSSSSPVFIESYSRSDFYDSEMWGQGKAGSSFSIGEKVLNSIRYSNRLIKTTRSSGVSRFDGFDVKALSYNFGDITAIRQIGYTLKVIFENNVASIMVNKTLFFDADGVSQVVKSDDVLGSVNYSEDIWGSINPESVLLVDRNLYFFDIRRKSYVRNSPNGSFPISDYKMKKYFIDKSDVLLTSGQDNIGVYSGWDDDRSMLYVGIKDEANRNNCEYILFFEDFNRWVTFTSPLKAIYKRLMQMEDQSISFYSVNTILNVGVFKSTITTSQASSFSGTIDFQPTNTVNILAGDVYSFSIEQAYSEGNIDDLGVIVITGTGDIPSTSFSFISTTSNPYTLSGTATQDSSINFFFRLTGSLSIGASDFSRIEWFLNITSKAVTSMQSAPSNLISVFNEDVYLHNDNATRCNFYDTQYNYKVRVYGGISNPSVIKTFDSIAIHSNAKWDIEDIQIPATLNYPNGMQSLIPEVRFEAEEGVLRSDYLCNMKTTSATASTIDLLNGDTLRGYTISNDLVGDETTEHNIYKVDILQTQSKF